MEWSGDVGWWRVGRSVVPRPVSRLWTRSILFLLLTRMSQDDRLTCTRSTVPAYDRVSRREAATQMSARAAGATKARQAQHLVGL